MLLPIDILLVIINSYADQPTLYNLGLTSNSISFYAIQQLWHMPYISTHKSLHQFSNTLSLPSTLYQYRDWVSGLALHIRSSAKNEYSNIYQTIPDSTFSNLQQLKLEILSLQQIDVNIISISFKNFITAQLNQGMSDLHIYECTPVTVEFILETLQIKERPYLRKLCFHDCHLTDRQVEHFATTCRHLQTLLLDRCGCLSDSSMVTIASSCQQLDTLVVTLPSHIIQSNTITTKTIEALEKHCLSLKQFVCSGQIRISEYIQTDNNRSANQFHISSHWI